MSYLGHGGRDLHRSVGRDERGPLRAKFHQRRWSCLLRFPASALERLVEGAIRAD